MDLLTAIFTAAVDKNRLRPKISHSKKFKHYISVKDPKRCTDCADNHGKIYEISGTPDPNPPVHPNCRCKIETMQTIEAGTATINGLDGADWMLKYKRKLPEYYISQTELEYLGWRKGERVSKYSNEKMLFGGEYKNNNLHLPQEIGRIWYEADLNYTGGKRNGQRILFSNDGLIFVTYDHYEIFYEII